MENMGCFLRLFDEEEVVTAKAGSTRLISKVSEHFDPTFSSFNFAVD